MKTFEEVWHEMESKGYDYGEDAIEQVKFGWQLYDEYVSQENSIPENFNIHLKEYEELVNAAQAVIARWNTPTWKDAVSTSYVINRLRNALKFFT